MSRNETLLMVADSEHDANMLYATGMFVPDPFIYLQIRNRRLVVMSDLEIDRARKQLRNGSVLSLRLYQERLRAAGVKQPGLADVIQAILRPRDIRRVIVPGNFPHGLAVDLARRHIEARPREGSFFGAREFKTGTEIDKISAALRMAEAGMRAGLEVLRASTWGRDRRLRYGGAVLTSERLRAAIDTAIIQHGGVASHTIVAGGDQGCDPHEAGHGPLRANEPIILDIFPRAQATGYFGDLTRTVVRGRASEEARRLYETVLAGQKLAFSKMRPGVPTKSVHGAVVALFGEAGYVTTRRGGRMEGFFHGTGHGLGLEIHELPRMGPSSSGELKRGQVVTVEPGLYYPGVGGVRLEDVAVLTGTGARNLTRCPKQFELANG